MKQMSKLMLKTRQGLLCFPIFAAVLLWASNGFAEEITIAAGRSVQVMSGAKVVATLEGPVTVRVIERKGDWQLVQLPDSSKTGYVLSKKLTAASTPAGQFTLGTKTTIARDAEPTQEIASQSPSGSPAAGDTSGAASANAAAGEPYASLRSGGRFRYSQQGDSDAVVKTFSLEFSPDGRYLAVGENNTKAPHPISTFKGNLSRNPQAIARLIDLQTGREIKRLIGHKGADSIASISFAPDSSYVATTGYSSNAALRGVGVPSNDLESLKVWRTSTGEELFALPRVTFATFSPDGQSLICHGSKQFCIREITNLEQRRELKIRWSLPAGGIPQGKPIVSADSQVVYVPAGKKVFAYDLKTGAKVREFPIGINGFVLAISEDGRVLAVAGQEVIVLLDAERGTELRRFPTKNLARRLYCDASTGQVAAYDRDGTEQTWDIQTGKLLGTKPNMGPVFARAPSGLVGAVDRKHNGFVEIVDMRTGNSLARIHQFDKPRRFLTELNSGVYYEGNSDVPLLLEGALPSKESVAKAFASIPFAPPTNQPRQGGGAEESDLGPQRRLYLLTVGVSDYKYSEYDLQSAAKDAIDIKKFFLSQDKRLYQVVTQDYTDKQATSANVLKGLQWLEQSCGAQDVAVVMFAGHAIQGRNGLYFMTHEGDAESIQTTCLNWTKVAQSISRVKAGNVLILTDCCHAGDFAARRRPTQDDIARAFEEKPGVFLFASSQGHQLSLEDADLQNGLFTHAALAGLNGAADANSDQQITFEELRDYVTLTVTRRTHGQQTPDVPLKSKVNWQLPIAEGSKATPASVVAPK